MYTRESLPILGIRWTYFATWRDAHRFAQWAIRFTKRDEHPCDAFITEDKDNPPNQRFVVKVVNW